MMTVFINVYVFFFNDTATTEIYTLSLHDALPICDGAPLACPAPAGHGRGGRHAGSSTDAAAPACHAARRARCAGGGAGGDRKSTRLNSSHANISYAVFCLKKKKELWHDEVKQECG